MDNRDVVVSGDGTLFAIRPLTDAARRWIDENVSAEGWMWLGNTLYVEHRYIADIVAGMEDAGLIVEWW